MTWQARQPMRTLISCRCALRDAGPHLKCGIQAIRLDEQGVQTCSKAAFERFLTHSLRKWEPGRGHGLMWYAAYLRWLQSVYWSLNDGDTVIVRLQPVSS